MANINIEKKIERFNIRTAELLCSIAVSMITAIVTVAIVMLSTK